MVKMIFDGNMGRLLLLYVVEHLDAYVLSVP